MDDEPMIPTPAYRDDREWMAEQYRTAALMGYGALLARNVDRQYDGVLDAMAKCLGIQRS